ncbi:potassium channel subfamily U member 1 isoform X2 [Hemicordylus capensis]|uniref:potassium channel subfamily U member 1 isoform X2 n=1 Tax=Hemicordylus capensis TaxID=884348 RepID=UPI0023031166|nr:potassium channel subfamily U member 1 isoform X2 [Hemicordylus capensis]
MENEIYIARQEDDLSEVLGSHCTQYIQMAFICSCLAIFLGGIIFILIYRINQFIYTFFFSEHLKGMFAVKNVFYIRWKGYFQDWVVMMLSGQTAVGRVLVILVFLFSIGSLNIYIMNCYSVKQFCLAFEDQTVAIDLIFNSFFLFYFGLRFLAASDKLSFWLEVNSMVDFFTITPVCVSFYLQRNWLGLRFLRALRLLELPKILQFLHMTTSGTSIKLSKLIAQFISAWLTAAGFVHWMENSGDPWVQQQNYHNLTYFECLYLIMATMSTVGYGDIVVRTALGRAFILIFIIAALLLFANAMTELVDILRNTKRYRGFYEGVKGRKYIVVCGDVNLLSVTAFLRDFLSQDTEEVTTEIVFLGEEAPCVELETIFRCYTAYTTFFEGSVMIYEDLQRIKMDQAEACLILADTCSPQPFIEDTSNIMRVLSIKNHCPGTRVIVQIIQSSNKVYLPKLPNWDWRRGDSIICFAELKLGLIAQSCVVPGLTKLLTSLFIREDSQKVSSLLKHQLEIEGQDYKVMTQYLSNDFANMSFQDVCRLCFVKLNLMLVAIEIRSGMHANSILINPSEAIKIHHDTLGFFIAKSPEEARRAHYYCIRCHSDLSNPENIGKCRCRRKRMRNAYSYQASRNLVLHQNYMENIKESKWTTDRGPGKSRSLGILPLSNIPDPSKPQKPVKEGSDSMLDATGMFHWCDSVPFKKALLKRKKVISQSDHIVACVFGEATSALIGLRNFVMPLRASNFTFRQLKPIVFIGNAEFLEREWEFLQNFPKLYVLEGTALSCADLKLANIKKCCMCAILSAHARGPGDQALVDTKSVLATLNIRSLQFKLNVTTAAKGGPTTDLTNQSVRVFYTKIPVITELKIASNAQFFQQRHNDESHEEHSRAEQLPKGTVFSDSFLDSVLCTTYHNNHVLALFQTLVTGGTSPELEEYLAEETVLTGSASDVVHVGPRDRCKLALYPVTNNPVALEDMVRLRRPRSLLLPRGAKKKRRKLVVTVPQRQDGKQERRQRTRLEEKFHFGDLYSKALDMFGILCFGVHRLKDEPNPYLNRRVIARPINHFRVRSTDLIFCLVPYNSPANDLTAVVMSLTPVKQKLIRGSPIMM